MDTDSKILNRIGIGQAPPAPFYVGAKKHLPISVRIKRVAHGYTVTLNRYKTMYSVTLHHGGERIGKWDAMSNAEAENLFSRVVDAVVFTVYEEKRALGGY